MLHSIGGNWYSPWHICIVRRPRPEQLHRHNKPMIHRQFLTRSNVKMIGNHALNDMPTQLRSTGERVERWKPPTLVFVLIFMRCANRESGHFIKKEPKSVVVINVDHIVRFMLVNPGMDLWIAIKKRLPIGVVKEFFLDRIAHCRNVRCGDTT